MREGEKERRREGEMEIWTEKDKVCVRERRVRNRDEREIERGKEKK